MTNEPVKQTLDDVQRVLDRLTRCLIRARNLGLAIAMHQHPEPLFWEVIDDQFDVMPDGGFLPWSGRRPT